MTRWMIVMSLVAACPLWSCQDDARCERARLDLDKTWAELRQAATRRKLEGVDVPSWMDIEKKAELLESSFMTRQVTWESASKATQELAAFCPAASSASSRSGRSCAMRSGSAKNTGGS